MFKLLTTSLLCLAFALPTLAHSGHPEHEPVRLAIPLTDVTTGLNGAMAILAALWHRKRTGQGQFIEVPLYDTGAHNTLPLAIQTMAGGALATRLGNALRADTLTSLLNRFGCDARLIEDGAFTGAVGALELSRRSG